MLAPLIEQCRKGDGEAIERLVRQFQERAGNYANAILRDADLAEDAVQEAFVAALQSLGQLRDAEAFPLWFRRIVRTQAIRILRHRRELPLPLDEGDHQAVATQETPIRRIEREELARRVREALQTLPEASRQAAELFYLDELSCAQTAETLQIPLGTVKRRLHDARRQLRDILAGSLESPAPLSGRRGSRRSGPRL